MTEETENKIPSWDILTTTGGFNMKTFYALLTIVTVFVLNIIATIISVVSNNNGNISEVGGVFITITVVSYLLTIVAIILGHKGLKEIRKFREKGQGFAYGILLAGYFSLFTVGTVFIIMDIIYTVLFLRG